MENLEENLVDSTNLHQNQHVCGRLVCNKRQTISFKHLFDIRHVHKLVFSS